MPCQLEECDGEGSNEATKVCLDHAVSLGACPDSPPPLYLCEECASTIMTQCASNELTDGQASGINFMDMLLPITQVSATCENKVRQF